MRRVLFISYYFPPDGGGGTQRAAKFVRHLPAHGWEPVVLTRTPPPRRTRWEPQDGSLEQEVAGAACRRVPWEKGEAAVPMHPDADPESHPWVTRAFALAERVIAEAKPEVIVITMPPYGLSGLALKLQRETTLPVVIDLRDPWALDGAPQYASRTQWRRSLDAMRGTLAGADGVIANTPEAQRVLHAEVAAGGGDAAWTTIPNGYDAEDFAGSANGIPEGYVSGAFHLVHAGTFHSPAYARHQGLRGALRKLRQYRARPVDVVGRTPLPLLQAVRELQERKVPGIERLRLVFAGVADDTTRAMVRDAGLSDVPTMTGYLSHGDAISWMRAASANFIPLHGLPEGERSRIIPGKLYEYLAAGRPILGAVPRGDARELLERSGLAELAWPTDAGSIADALERMLARGDQNDAPPPFWLNRYERGAQASELAGFLGTVVGGVRKHREPEPIERAAGLAGPALDPSGGAEAVGLREAAV